MASLTQVLVFISGCGRYRSPSQRSSILTASSCGFMTVCSLPFFLDWVQSGGNLAAVQPRPALAETACVGLMAYMIFHLALGVLFYRRELLLGWHWIHHAIFTFVLSFAIRNHVAHYFVLAGTMEFPIYVMFVGFLEPSLRNDYLTAVTTFAFRIVFHLILLVQWCLPTNRLLVGSGINQWVPASLAITALPGHIQLCYSTVQRAIRSSKQKQALLSP
ncbi:hypothetical protein CALCODRAFT_442704 [Calocera cornea HHB12733]|uniref:TLC domain-containing protein n=1 Tax=Calocera cornea HHB12733 TaxID=1353952 RepID=A0A165CZA4_9BASI|nr:hypothetical protein CALCODRAFT_442704 [Calocera cornea HHB12733]